MLRLGLLAAKRERNNTIAKFQQKYVSFSNGSSSIVRTLSSSSSTSSTSSSPDVAVQLDYYMSLQFAGVATALVNGEKLLLYSFISRMMIQYDEMMILS